MSIKDIIQQLRVTMDDAKGQESHFESWLTQNEGICEAIDSLKILDTLPAAQPEQEPCIGKDPRCPCQDGDACHYKDCGDTKAWPVPEQEPVAYDKTEINCFVQSLYDEKMQEGKHGHYETMFYVVHQAIKKVAPPKQPEQEPVAWIERDMQCDDFDPDSVTCEKQTITADGWEWIPLYTPPPAAQRPWVGLTDDEHEEIVEWLGHDVSSQVFYAIEAKLKEKNT